MTVQSIQLFLENPRCEIATIEALNSFLGFSVDSMQCEIPGSVGFVQISNYTQGFPQGLLITWPSEISLASTSVSVVINLAEKLNTRILVEPDEEDNDWLLIAPSGLVSNVVVEVLDDGITIENK